MLQLRAVRNSRWRSPKTISTLAVARFRLASAISIHHRKFLAGHDIAHVGNALALPTAFVVAQIPRDPTHNSRHFYSPAQEHSRGFRPCEDCCSNISITDPPAQGYLDAVMKGEGVARSGGSVRTHSPIQGSCSHQAPFLRF